MGVHHRSRGSGLSRPGGHCSRSCGPAQCPRRGVSLHDHAKCPKRWHRKHLFLFSSQRSTLPMNPLLTRKPLSSKRSAPSAVSNQMPREANFPSALSFFLSQATSSIRSPGSFRSFSFMIFSIACAFAFSRSKSSVGVRCTTTSNLALTSFVLFPSSCSHSMLLRAASADAVSLNRMTYPVLVVPTPATWASCVDAVFDNAVRI